EMAECDPAKALRREDAADGIAVQREHLSQAGVKHQRRVAHHHELVEGEAGRRRDVGHVGREPENAVGDLVDFRFHDNLRAITGLKSLGSRTAEPVDGHRISLYIHVYRNWPTGSIWMHIIVQ